MSTIVRGNNNESLGIATAGSATVGTSAVTLISPGANTTGIIIRTLSINSPLSASVAVYAGATAPTGVGDITSGRVVIGRISTSTGSGGFGLDFNQTKSVYVKPGVGVYAIASAAGANYVNLSYDLAV